MSTIHHKISCLAAAAVTSPEYAGIVPLFIELFRYVEKTGRDTGIVCTLSRDNLKEKMEGGFPLLDPSQLRVDDATCTIFLNGLLGVLKNAGQAGGEELERIQDALVSGTIPYISVFKAIIERNRSVIDQLSAAVSVSSPLLEYVFEIPLKSALEQLATGVSQDELEGWQEGYCPVCGSRAGMAELVGEEGKRYLSCSACSFRWSFKRLQCPFCGNDKRDELSYLSIGEASATRVDTCKTCSRYIKTRDSRKGNADVPLDVEDLLTMHLDLIAVNEGFERGK